MAELFGSLLAATVLRTFVTDFIVFASVWLVEQLDFILFKFCNNYIASYFSRLDRPIRLAIQALGSSFISVLGFRDVWAFIGQKGIEGFSPLEQVIFKHQPCWH